MGAITKEKLEENLKQIEDTYKLHRHQALAQYARSNDIVEDSDLVTDHIGTIKVHSRKVHFAGVNSCMAYHGVRHKRDGTPFKSGEFRWVYQGNIESINGVSTKQ